MRKNINTNQRGNMKKKRKSLHEKLMTLDQYRQRGTVLEYDTNRPSNPPNGKVVQCYLEKVRSQVCSIVVFAPSKLNNFQVWTVDTHNFWENIKAIPSETPTWGGY